MCWQKGSIMPRSCFGTAILRLRRLRTCVGSMMRVILIRCSGRWRGVRRRSTGNAGRSGWLGRGKRLGRITKARWAGGFYKKARLRCVSLATVLSAQNTVAKDRRLPSTFLFSCQSAATTFDFNEFRNCNFNIHLLARSCGNATGFLISNNHLPARPVA